MLEQNQSLQPIFDHYGSTCVVYIKIPCWEHQERASVCCPTTATSWLSETLNQSVCRNRLQLWGTQMHIQWVFQESLMPLSLLLILNRWRTLESRRGWKVRVSETLLQGRLWFFSPGERWVNLATWPIWQLVSLLFSNSLRIELQNNKLTSTILWKIWSYGTYSVWYRAGWLYPLSCDEGQFWFR